MKIPLPLRWHRSLFLAAVVLAGAYLATDAVRVTLVQTWVESTDIRDIERAAILDKNNAELYYRRGIHYLFAADVGSSNSLELLRKATELNPKIGKYWMGLGRGCFLEHDLKCADQSFEKAIRLSPTAPRIEWETAAYYALTDRAEESFVHLRRLLQLDPLRAPAVFDFTWRAFEPNDVWRMVIVPLPNPRVRCEYLAFLLDQHRLDLAMEYWTDTVRSSPVPPIEAATSYIEGLLRVKQYGEAAKVWQDLRRLGAMPRASVDKNNLVFNGGFEQPTLDAAFDWHTTPGSYVAVSFSDKWIHDGTHALWVNYTAPHNTDDESAFELVPVDADTRYVLTGYSRSEDIASDSGPRLRVLDPECQACLNVSTDMTVATTPWHEIKLEFSTGPNTHVVRLSVWRPRSRTFPMDITGNFWLDSVSLVAQGPFSRALAMQLTP